MCGWEVGVVLQASIPIQLHPQSLGPVLRENFVHVIFLQTAFMTNAEQGIQPTDEVIDTGNNEKWL